MINKVRAINEIYRELERETKFFKKSASIACFQGCDECCRYRDIEATILEFLPAAYILYRSGRAEELKQRLDSVNDTGICVFFNPFLNCGGCSVYDHRGLICRLFGFAARTDKNGQPHLISCRKIKSVIRPDVLLENIAKAPVGTAYYMKLFGIDPQLALPYYPINQAIQKAIELVLFQNQFRRRRKAS